MKEHVLIVEDEKDTAWLLEYNLQKKGYQTKIACNGVEAINILESYTPDLVLLDLMMPGINGWEVCNYIREKDEFIPIIMLTALSSEDDIIKGLSTGADDYISKPFSVKELLFKIERHVKKERSLANLKAQVVEEQDRLDTFIHEVKSSFAAIEGLAYRAGKRKEKDKYLSLIESGAQHLNSLINNLSFLNHLEREGEDLPLEPVNLLDIVEQTVDALKSQAEKRGISINILNSTPHLIRGDSTAVRQVLLNLISNAIKYNRDGGEIRIAFEETHDHIDLLIRDSGMGIPQEDISQVFEKGYRANKSSKIDGKGIGLYLVKGLMEAMKGNIGVTSRQDMGSLFTASFASNQTLTSL